MKTMVHGIMRDIDAEEKAYRQRSKNIALAANNSRLFSIARCCQRCELEPDEFLTKEQKALQTITLVGYIYDA